MKKFDECKLEKDHYAQRFKGSHKCPDCGEGFVGKRQTVNTIKVTKASIKQCIRNGKKLKWKPKRIATTLHYLGFSDKEIDEAM